METQTGAPGSSGPGAEMGSPRAALAGPGASLGRVTQGGSRVPLPAAGAAGSVGHIPDKRSGSHQLLIPPLFPLLRGSQPDLLSTGAA